MSSIQTTHVGSLPRSKELSEFLFAKDRGENFNQSNFDNILKDNVEKVVKQQIDVGIDFVSDGEMMTSQIIKKRLPRVEVLLPIQGHAVQMSLS